MPTEPRGALPPSLRAKVLELAARNPSPTRDALRKRTAFWLALGLSLPVALLVLVGGVERGQRPPLLLAATTTGTLGLSLVALGVALGYGGRGLGRPRLQLLSSALLLPLVLILWKLGCSSAFLGMTQVWPTRPGLRCFGLSLLFGLAPLIAFLAARRKSDPVHPVTLGAALGAAGGLWGASFVDLWCPAGHPLHVILGHALPSLLLATVGGWAGARVLATPPSSEPR
jgi:hypothetical protein